LEVQDNNKARANRMVELKISLFGGFEVEVCEEEEGRESKKVSLGRPAQLLLAFIILHRNRPHTREALAEKIWPGQNKLQGRLRTTLWRLRDYLETTVELKGRYITITKEGDIRFNSECSYWFDVAEFEKHIATTINSNPRECSEYLDRYDKALALYRGDLLEGFYEEWIANERERLRCIYIESLERQFYYCIKHHIYHRALSYARKILDQDPIREHIHRDVMRLYAASHRRAEAIRQYKTCVNILKKELDIGPMEETVMLYNNLRRESYYLNTPHINSDDNQADYSIDLQSKTILGLNEAKQYIENAISDITNDRHGQ
jgi:DNA-binding SARP family transcriptional activator